MIIKIKQLADEAIKLQNKNRMDEVLREISAMCDIDIVAAIDEKIKKETKAVRNSIKEYGLTYKVPEELAEELRTGKTKGGKK